MEIALKVATSLELEGILAVEMFFMEDGRVLANELAPRPHNSGHGTIEACVTSQFEQYIRAACNLPLGNPRPHSGWQMVNLIGDDIQTAMCMLRDPTVSVHVYGKKESRPGRKMGHLTELQPL